MIEYNIVVVLFFDPSLVDFWIKHQYRRQATPQENVFKTHTFIRKINILFCHPRTRLVIGPYSLVTVFLI